jgi:hypothetical protein
VTVPWPPARVIAHRGDLRVSTGRAGVVLQDDPAIPRADDEGASRGGYSAIVRALTSLGARVQALPPGRADLLLAGAFLLETQVELSFLDASTGTVLAVRGLTLVMALGVVARRRAPFVAAGLVFAALTAMEQLGDQANTSLVGPYLAAFVITYPFGANLGGRLRVGDRGPGGGAPGRVGGGGHGLVGVRERVRIFGGDLHTGRRAGGGFEVRARIGLDGRAEHA